MNGRSKALNTVDTNDLLTARGTTHGEFRENSDVSQKLKEVVSTALHKYQAHHLTCFQREALDLICHKIGRICAGDPHFRDHWDDIAGYATLVSERISNPKE